MLSAAVVAASATLGFAMPAQAVPAEVSGATLSWGVKESFRGYINGPIAGGSAETFGGVSGTGPYTWSAGTGSVETDTQAAEASFGGGCTSPGTTATWTSTWPTPGWT